MPCALNASDEIMFVAQLLEVSEMQVFERAYNDWHHQRASDEILERCLTDYMYQGRVPVWAQSFARRTLTDPTRPAPAPAKASGLDIFRLLFIPPHGPETLGAERYNVLVA